MANRIARFQGVGSRVACGLAAGAVLGLSGCDAPAPPGDQTPRPVPEASQGAVATPAPFVRPSPEGLDSAERATEPVEMYSLDYDERLDRFFVPGTRKLYNGPVYTLFDDGTKASEGEMKDGVEHGTWVEFHEDGIKSSEGAYIDGDEDGLWTFWWENGAVETRGAYKKGSPTGEWVSFFEDGSKDSEGLYADGLMDGDWTFYDQETGEKTVIRFDRGRRIDP